MEKMRKAFGLGEVRQGGGWVQRLGAAAGGSAAAVAAAGTAGCVLAAWTTAGWLAAAAAACMPATPHKVSHTLTLSSSTLPPPNPQVVWGEAFDAEAQARKKAEAGEARRAAEKEAYERREA